MRCQSLSLKTPFMKQMTQQDFEAPFFYKEWHVFRKPRVEIFRGKSLNHIIRVRGLSMIARRR
jgi:hypothetical protein